MCTLVSTRPNKSHEAAKIDQCVSYIFILKLQYAWNSDNIYHLQNTEYASCALAH